MDKQSVEILRGVDALLSDDTKWIQGYDAKDARGVPVECTDASASKWCMIGAIHAVAKELYPGINAAKYVHDTIPANKLEFRYGISVYNDRPDTSFPEVKAWIKRAIKKAESDGD